MTEDIVRRYDVARPHLREALRPSSAPWAVGTGVRALVAAAIIAVAGVTFGEPASIGVAYFAATMSTLFAVGGTHRARLTAMAMQAAGAIAGIVVGTVTPHTVVIAVLVAASMAMVAGMVAALDPAFSAFSLLLVVGTAYGQFGGSPLPVGTQCLWYLIGSAIVSAIVASETITVASRYQRAAVAAVLAHNATLLDAIGGPDAGRARRALADTATDCRSTLYAYRMTMRRGSETVDAIEAAAQTARRVTLVVAALYARGLPVPATAAELVRAAAEEVAAGSCVTGPDVNADAAQPVRLIASALAVPACHPSVDDTESAAPPAVVPTIRSAVTAATRRESIGSGVRLALCIAVATAAAALLHGEHHAFWLPLTVAVVVRPELQSVFVRVINRVAGSMIGAALAAALLLAAPGNWALALGAALSMGLSAMCAPKVYGLFVIGITSSTLLSASIGEINPLAPELRLLDSLIGCAIAILVGYVLWPRRMFVVASPHASTATLVAAYLRAAADPDASAQTLGTLRRRAYDRAHTVRRSLQSAVLEPAALSPRVRPDLQVALAVEDVLDDITDLAFEVAETREAPPGDLLDAVEADILAVGAARPTLTEGDVPDVAGGAGPLQRMRGTLATWTRPPTSA